MSTFHKISWFKKEHEILTHSKDILDLPAVSNYINAIDSGLQPVSDEVDKLVHNVLPMVLDMVDNGKVYLDLTMVQQVIAVPANAFPYGLYDWEAFLTIFMVGFRFSDDDTLCYDEYLLYMARGAGKNGYMSWMIFSLLSKINGIPHYDVAVSASAERQAKTSFTDIFNVLAETDPEQRVFRRTKTEIEHRETKSVFQFLSSNATTADGLRLGALYLDEIHAIDSYDMLNVLKSSLGKIPDARIFITTTDGYTRGSVLDSYKEQGRQVLDGELGINYPKDDLKHSRLLPFMCCINDLNEAKDERGWYKANPSLRFNKQLLQQYRKEVIQIDRNAELNIEFHVKRVNYPKEDNRFALATREELEATKEKCLADYVEEYGDNEVYGCVDWSNTRDLTSVGLIAHDQLHDRYFYEHESFITHNEYTNGQINPKVLQAGKDSGKLNVVYTKDIEERYVVDYFVKMSERYYINKIFIDQFKSTLLKPALEKAGFEVVVVPVKMVTETMIAPQIDKMFAQGNMFAGNDPLFTWAMNNLQKDITKNGVRFIKIEPKARKTDPASAFISGLIGLLDNEPDHQDGFIGKFIG